MTRPKKTFSCVKEGDMPSILNNQKQSKYRVRNPVYFRPIQIETIAESEIKPDYDVDMITKCLSKFSWKIRRIPLSRLDQIVVQLQNGNEFLIPYSQWNNVNSNDLDLFVGYYEEIYHTLCRIKVTNNDRRRLINLKGNSNI